MDWDPMQPNITVALKDKPGKIGQTTGKTKGEGSRLLVQVRYGPNEAPYKRYSVLVPVIHERGIDDIIEEGAFGSPEDLRKILVLEKLKGQLTNVFYSMNVGNTDFYPHQFKPVLKFIESIHGKLLIADEVGLGKTIESIYIWKELQARNDARRLLIICPSMLREKWQNDLYTRFNIDADIVKANEICEILDKLIAKRDNRSFVCISSLEGLRPPANFNERIDSKKGNIRFAQLVEKYGDDIGISLFDLVIIDEAHYMRNPGTASFRLGQLMRDAASNLLLLTATPIQTDAHNLYQLLRLINPDVFFTTFTFELLLKINRPILRMLSALQENPFNMPNAREAVHKLMEESFAREDPSLQRLQHALTAGESLTYSEKAEYTTILESRSILAPFMSRTRKRDVMENRVIRNAKVLPVSFSAYETKVYKTLSAAVLREAGERTGIPAFILISRQRQMASSLAAALEGWKTGTYFEDLQEWLWEDLGMMDEVGSRENYHIEHADKLADRFSLDPAILRHEDSKYSSLLATLKEIYRKNPGEKCIIFAFFRNTLRYLGERLTEDGLRITIIMGGIKPEEKSRILKNFENSSEPQILLSSEVGSEGIDLQFCSILFNYDLPWNPMRVEQRIGRIDRLGQKAEKIHIYNFASFDTVEEKILIRLYERIGIFEESVGDMEEILGETASKILDDVYNPELTDDEKMTRTEASLSALENKRKLQNRIEENAINLIGFSDYIYKNINTSKENQRWISKQDLLNFIADFFAFQYKGTVIEMEEGGLYRYRLSLSPEARSKLSLFISEDKPQRATRLHQLERVLVSFETDESNRKYEKIDILHPLILWIRKEYDQKSMHPVSAIELDYQGINNTCAFVEEGTYFYRVHRWKISGLKEYEQLIFLCFHYESGKLLEDNESEKLVLSAVLEGRTVVNARNTLEDTHTYTEVFQKIDAILQARYEALYDERSIENMRLCSTQKDSARMYKDRKLADLTNRIQKFREEGKDRLIPMTQGLIDKEESIWLNKVTRIEAMEGLEDEQVDIAAGVIVIR